MPNDEIDNPKSDTDVDPLGSMAADVFRTGPFAFLRLSREGELLECFGRAASLLNFDRLRAGACRLAPDDPAFAKMLAQLAEGRSLHFRSHVLHREPNQAFDVYLMPDGGEGGALGLAFEVPAAPSVTSEFERFFELSLDLFCVAGLDGRFRVVNEAFEHLLGYDAAELVAVPFLEFVHPDDRTATLQEVEKLAQGDPTVTFVNRYQHKQGGYQWLEWNAMPIPEEGVIYAVARDVTAVHEADQRMREMSELLRVTERINSGVTLDDVIDSIHDGLRGTIPFNRLSVAMIDASRERVVSRWVRSDRGIRLGVGFSAPLRGSSLEAMVADPKPRILNDLPAHLVAHPESTSTALMVDEGMRSSLTCPLVVDGQTVGFLFFSSVESHRYENCHVTTYRHLAAQIAGMVEKARLYSELDSKTRYIEDQVEAVSRDLALARDLQQHLTPQAMPSLPNLDLSHLYEPASQVGGDILEVTRVDDNRVLVFLGDAMGHGVRSALVMSLTVALFQNEAEGDPDPAHICSRLNRKLYALLNNEFVTATCALFDATSCTADVVLAGHPSPLLLDARTQLIHTKQTDSMPLGIESTESFRSRRFELQPNDCLLFYTDGLIDARGRGREHFGRDRLLGHLLKCNGRSSRELVQTIREDLARHVGHRSLTDDVCIFAAKAL